MGGGGLIAGVAAWFQGRVKVVGVEPEGSRALHAALEADKPVDVSVQSIAADSLGAKRIGEVDFDIAKRFVSGVALVKDAAIAEAQRRLWADFRSSPSQAGRRPSPPSSAAPIGRSRDERVGVLVCGSNADLKTFLPREDGRNAVS